MMGATKVLVAGVFDRHVRPYEARVEAMRERGQTLGRELALRWLAAKPGERVLDLGCGPGILTLPLARAVGPTGHVIAVDLAPGMLARLRKLAPANVRTLMMDVEQLELGDGEFDAVAAGYVFQFCPHLDCALSEAHRVLRQDGRLAATFPAAPGRLTAPAFDGIRELLPPMPPDLADTGAETMITRMRLGDERGIRHAVLAAGFRWLKVHRVEEPLVYDSPEALLEAMNGWWEWAWRMERLSELERQSVREMVLDGLRSRYGDGPVDLPTATNVLYARA